MQASLMLASVTYSNNDQATETNVVYPDGIASAH